MLPSNNFFQKHCKERGIPFRKKEILREYLQMQTLQALSVSGFNDSLSFLGGTALRFGFGIDRFSEDLDFDLLDGKNFSVEEFDREIRDKLKSFGLKTDTRVRETENIYILYLKFRDVLREFGFNVPRDQKLLVKFEIDTSPLKSIETQTILVDSFNERFPLLFNDKRTLFAQKFVALANRPYQKGRDFYDLVWFLAQKDLEPNYKLLREKGYEIDDKKEFARELRKIIEDSDLKQAVKDVENFLFHPEKAKWILNVGEYLEGWEAQFI